LPRDEPAILEHRASADLVRQDRVKVADSAKTRVGLTAAAKATVASRGHGLFA